MGTHTSKSSAAGAGGSATVPVRDPASDFEARMRGLANEFSAVSAPLDMQQLSGSERQQQYARDIVNRMISDTLPEGRITADGIKLNVDGQVAVIRDGRGEGILDGTYGEYAYRSKGLPALQATRQALEKVLNGISSASDIIDKRDEFRVHGKIASAIWAVKLNMDKVIRDRGYDAAVDAAARHIKKAFDAS